MEQLRGDDEAGILHRDERAGGEGEAIRVGIAQIC